MMKGVRTGFLPLYVKLYDETNPEMRPRIEAFNISVVKKLKEFCDVIEAPICRVKNEFEQAVRMFEEENVDAIVTMHLAYSPSLESVEILARTSLPIIVMDTTAEYDFSSTQSTDEIMYNHGIHGVQDLCNMLLRHNKKFFIEAGHYEKSDVILRVFKHLQSINIMKSFVNARVGIVGTPFKGMGDFQIPFDEITHTFGISIISYDMEKERMALDRITDQEIEADLELCKANYNVVDISDEFFYRSAPTNLMLRKWIDENSLNAITVNFLAAQPNSGLPIMPFLEISRSMARGIGFAGEGDVLTAALTGALLQSFPETTFTEMFCPDWKHGTIFVSHMGEININLTAEKPIITEKIFPFTDADNPVVAFGRLKPGYAIIVDLAPRGNSKYNLILVEVEMLDVTDKDNMERSVHGWFKPINMSIERFLEKYSLSGGTHHFALVYGDVIEEVKGFGELMNFNVINL